MEGYGENVVLIAIGRGPPVLASGPRIGSDGRSALRTLTGSNCLRHAPPLAAAMWMESRISVRSA